MKKLEEHINKLRIRDPKVMIAYNSERDGISLIRGKLSEPLNVAELKKAPFQKSRQFIRENRALFSGLDEKKQLDNSKATTDPRGRTHVVFQQMYGEAHVLGANISVHYNADGSIYLIKSNLKTSISLDKKASIRCEQAVRTAEEHAGYGSGFFPDLKPILVVGDGSVLQQDNQQKYYLCWQLGITTPNDKKSPGWVYFVDAINNKVLFRYSAIRTGTGTGLYSHGTSLTTEGVGSTFRLRNSEISSAWSVITKPAVHTYDDNGLTGFSLVDYSEDNGDTWDNGGGIPANRRDDQRPEVDIHRFAGYVMNYYFHTHGHNGWDNSGRDIRAHAHNEYLANNAYWYSLSRQVYFADGNGVTRNFMCPLDTVTHEITHGVKYFFNILQTYDGETGALDEATSDLFGAFVAMNYPADDPEPWHHGNLYRLDGTNGRNMADPSRDAAGVVRFDATSDATKVTSCQNGYYPDHYSIRYAGAGDYHGVHYNAPIITHAIYLMINGGTHRLSNVTVNGIGVAPVEQMLYEVVSTGLLTNTSDFSDFRIAVIQACQTLYPDNLDYLSSVKSAFHAVGIGPDLYIRDRLADQGGEPGILSSMSPDIIVRQEQADVATLAQIADPNNSSLCEQIEFGSDDHYVYFRIFNRGSTPASGTFRLFISPVSTFPVPGSWHEVGHYDFSDIPAGGGLWAPSAAEQCITLPATLINTLGLGHYCFIGIVESPLDPAPDRMLIDNISEFHNFISKSNNFAWRNCDVVDLQPDASGDIPTAEHTFHINGFGRWHEKRNIEIDTRDLPEGTKIVLCVPSKKLWGLKAFEAVEQKIQVTKIAGVLEGLPLSQSKVRPIPLSDLMDAGHVKLLNLKEIKERELKSCRTLIVSPRKVVRLEGIALETNEKMDIRLFVKFPKNTGARDASLTFSERWDEGILGQVNYVYKIRNIR